MDQNTGDVFKIVSARPDAATDDGKVPANYVRGY
ncbi:unnamed protein product, partial [Rotaria sordida]